ncbi:MAG: peptidase T [Ruminococcaceae bacterium]|nr:peptidase T [Oscillospiraceae bacterium]
MNVSERFLKYVSFPTASDEFSDTVPSTAKQKKLGEYIAEELKAMGMENVILDNKGYVYAELKGNIPGAIGFIAHMDTSPDAPDEPVNTRTIEYNGGDIILSEGIITSVKDYPFIEKYKGQHLIVTDGKTLLGADDKAGVAEIVSACEYFINNPDTPHKTLAICFTPDEEIGRGADHFDYERFAAKEAYTVDGGTIGEIEYENFNAASAEVKINGVIIHPGSAKNKMKNAALYVAQFMSMMPQNEIPACTEGYEGFYHIHDIKADETQGSIRMIIRDHDREKFESKKSFLNNLVSYLNSVHGEGTFSLEIKDSYYNMKEKIKPFMYLIENAKAAFIKTGITPECVPIRGGTDGARLSYEGLPCPNLSTGGENFHSVREFISVESLEKMVQVLIALSAM